MNEHAVQLKWKTETHHGGPCSTDLHGIAESTPLQAAYCESKVASTRNSGAYQYIGTSNASKQTGERLGGWVSARTPEEGRWKYAVLIA
jgi:hypothetical protein